MLMSSVINIVIAVGSASLTARLYFSGLHRRYRAFFLYMAFFTLQSAALLALAPDSGAYQKVWVLSEPFEWFFYAWVVLELFSLVLRDYQGLYTVGRWSLILATSIALLASVFSLAVPSHATTQGRLLAYYYVAERAVYFSLVVFLLTILILLTRYPITLNRNTIIHSLIFSVYFAGNAAIFLMLSTHGSGVLRIATYATLAVNLGALGTWLAMLNPAGERCSRKLRPAWMPGREDELSNQLNSLNAALLRVARG
jgi:hypothetical protein